MNSKSELCAIWFQKYHHTTSWFHKHAHPRRAETRSFLVPELRKAGKLKINLSFHQFRAKYPLKSKLSALWGLLQMFKCTAIGSILQLVLFITCWWAHFYCQEDVRRLFYAPHAEKLTARLDSFGPQQSKTVPPGFSQRTPLWFGLRSCRSDFSRLLSALMRPTRALTHAGLASAVAAAQCVITSWTEPRSRELQRR